MTRSRLAIVLLACAAFGVGIALATWLGVPGRGAGPGMSAERPRIEGNVELVGPDGRTVAWAQLGDRLQLVFFGFTNCPEVCPTTLARATEALASLGEEAAGLRLLLISVDPERDTPAVMGAYTEPFAPRVLGLSGTSAQIAAAAAAFGVFYEKVPMSMPGEYMVNHTASVFLLGPGDEILEIVPNGATATEIADAVRRHL
jgi:protein SCO1/2